MFQYPRPSTRTTTAERASGRPSASWSRFGSAWMAVGIGYPMALEMAGSTEERWRAPREVKSSEIDGQREEREEGRGARGERQKRGRARLRERECGKRKSDVEQTFQRTSKHLPESMHTSTQKNVINKSAHFHTCICACLYVRTKVHSWNVFIPCMHVHAHACMCTCIYVCKGVYVYSACIIMKHACTYAKEYTCTAHVSS